MQLPLVTVEQLVEGVTVAGDVGCQQLGVSAFSLAVSPETHGRTVTNRWVARHFTNGWPVSAVRTLPEP
jgi:hypothetical protein